MIAFTRFIFIGFCLVFTTASNAADNYVVSYVYDGDTVKLRPIQLNTQSGELKLRLTDIDAPERNQAYGKQSRRALNKLCKGNNIKVNVQLLGIDKYNRYLGKLQCNHTDASVYLAEHGLAWHNTKYSNNTRIANAASKARQQRLGLWKSKNPLPPWVWRHKHPH
ncbi:MAG TPA: thermonuclease family protein [Methylotenera sp.]|nr:thermonuclease family protein [Methylotenera sp.]